ncbi:MAG: glycosyltransferase family 39 protein [Methylococcaceae bacterium]
MKKNNIQNGFINLMLNQYVIFIFLFFILLLVMSNGVMGSDEGMWSYMGRVWIENNIPPYVGAVDNKTPGIFELFAISHMLFGVNYYFARVLGVMAILFSSLTVYLIGKELHTHLAGIFSMVIFGLTMQWILLDGPLTAQTETFMVLFSTLSFYFVIKGKDCLKWRFWIFLAGFSMGLAIAFKQIGLTTAIAMFIFFIVYGASGLTSKDKLFGIFLLSLGITIATFFSLVPLLVSNVSLKEYINGSWLMLLNPGSSAPIQQHLHNFFHVFLNTRIVVFYPFFGLLICQSDLIKNRYFIGLLIWMVFDFIGVNGAGTYYGHQIKQLIPSVSIIIGILLSNLLLKHVMEKSEISKYASNLLIFLIVLLFPYITLILNGYSAVTGGYSAATGDLDKRKELGLWLRENTDEKDYVYVDGCAGPAPILSYSGRVSPSKYFNTCFVSRDAERQQLLSDFKVKPPLFYVKASDTMGTKIDGFIKDNYELLHTKQEYKVFKRKSK